MLAIICVWDPYGLQVEYLPRIQSRDAFLIQALALFLLGERDEWGFHSLPKASPNCSLLNPIKSHKKNLQKWGGNFQTKEGPEDQEKTQQTSFHLLCITAQQELRKEVFKTGPWWGGWGMTEQTSSETLPHPHFIPKLWLLSSVTPYPLSGAPPSSYLHPSPLPSLTSTHHLILGKVSIEKALEREPQCIVFFLETTAAPVLDLDSAWPMIGNHTETQQVPQTPGNRKLK